MLSQAVISSRSPGSRASEAVESVGGRARERIERSAPQLLRLLTLCMAGYAHRKHHPVLQYLPTKLAEWIGKNMQDELGFPDKKDPRK